MITRAQVVEAVRVLVDDAIARHGINGVFEAPRTRSVCVFDVEQDRDRIIVSRSPHDSEGLSRVSAAVKSTSAFDDGGEPNRHLIEAVDKLASSYARMVRRRAWLDRMGFTGRSPAWSFTTQPLMRHLIERAGVDIEASIAAGEALEGNHKKRRGIPLHLEAPRNRYDLIFLSCRAAGGVLVGKVSLRGLIVEAAKSRTTIHTFGERLDGTLLNSVRGVPLTSLIGHDHLAGADHIKVSSVRNGNGGLAAIIKDPPVPLCDVPPHIEGAWSEFLSEG